MMVLIYKMTVMWQPRKCSHGHDCWLNCPSSFFTLNHFPEFCHSPGISKSQSFIQIIYVVKLWWLAINFLNRPANYYAFISFSLLMVRYSVVESWLWMRGSYFLKWLLHVSVCVCFCIMSNQSPGCELLTAKWVWEIKLKSRLQKKKPFGLIF